MELLFRQTKRRGRRSAIRTAQLNLASNDVGENPFVIALSEFGISSNLDNDGDARYQAQHPPHKASHGVPPRPNTGRFSGKGSRGQARQVKGRQERQRRENALARLAGPGRLGRHNGGLKGRDPLLPFRALRIRVLVPALRAGLWNSGPLGH